MKTLIIAAALASLCACGGRRPPLARPDSVLPPDPPVDPRPVTRTPPPTAKPILDEPLPAPVIPVVKPRRDLAAAIDATNAALADAYFAYDRSDLTDDGMAALRNDAALLAPLLAEFPDVEIVVEGHCDERGSAEYNLGLGDRRAGRASAFLQTLGIAPDRLRIISYGNERPQCEIPAESCWRLNRRAHLALQRRAT